MVAIANGKSTGIALALALAQGISVCWEDSLVFAAREGHPTSFQPGIKSGNGYCRTPPWRAKKGKTSEIETRTS
jgi:hypothetical protein